VPKAEAEPASVLDASALIAHLHSEPGAQVVGEALTRRSAIGVVNWAEVLSKLSERGEDPEAAASEMRDAGLIGELVVIEGLSEADCLEIGRLRPLTKSLGLSLADRACLALAERLGVPALTTDGSWAEADIDAEVILIR
jgi:PIN domain nuclease of toxin-antitoxin system